MIGQTRMPEQSSATIHWPLTAKSYLRAAAVDCGWGAFEAGSNTINGSVRNPLTPSLVADEL
jgi:hypothetical protein